MGSFNKLTLYDFMTMLIIGALIVAPFSTVDGFVCTMVFLIISYVIGLCYHKILDWLQSLLKLRNNECMIRKAFEVVCKEFPSASSLSNDINAIKESYYREYYRLMLKRMSRQYPGIGSPCGFYTESHTRHYLVHSLVGMRLLQGIRNDCRYLRK